MEIDEAEIVDLTRTLVQIDTSNPPGNEEPAARVLGDYLSGEGLAVDYLKVEPGRTILVARLPGGGRAGSLVFSGHLDVVPAREPGWTHDPFVAVQEGDRLTGRGAADMKGGLAAMAVALVWLRRRCFTPRSDLMLIASVGEERMMVGAKFLAATGAVEGCGYLVVGEPTGLDVCPAQRGALVFLLTVHGRGAHSSMPELGISAISFLARAITALEAHRFSHDAHPLLGSPSLNVGIIEGGVAPNIIADRCSAAVSIRLVPGQTLEVVESEVRGVLGEVVEESGLQVRFDLEVIGGAPAVATPLDDPLLQAATAAVQEATGRACRVRGFTGGTEAGYLCAANPMPMVIVGPGNLEQAHAVDEYIEIPSLSQAAGVYARIAQALMA